MSTIQSLDFSADILRSLLWQYNKAERLEKIQFSKQAWYDENQRDFWANWYRDVFDLRTANEFGCQVWARILGMKLAISSDPTNPDQPSFSFGALRGNFERGNFGQSGAGTVVLTLEQQRLVLRLRYFQLITRATTPEINRFMSMIFAGTGAVFVQDHLDMSRITYVFDFAPGSQLYYIFEKFDLLARPSTVGIEYLFIARETFGFGAFNQNFENGTFANL